MPLYQYRCKTCKHEFDQFRPMSQSAQDSACPGCKQQAVRVLSVFSTLSLNSFSGPACEATGASCAAESRGCACCVQQ
ncbi:MAG: zinc ribbon domain-containing protein [Dehalococcoidia bacterium]|nr:zinc ribbon domain-containing protein [Dehalococcoidia bacterium]